MILSAVFMNFSYASSFRFYPVLNNLIKFALHTIYIYLSRKLIIFLFDWRLEIMQKKNALHVRVRAPCFLVLTILVIERNRGKALIAMTSTASIKAAKIWRGRLDRVIVEHAHTFFRITLIMKDVKKTLKYLISCMERTCSTTALWWRRFSVQTSCTYCVLYSWYKIQNEVRETKLLKYFYSLFSIFYF